MGIFSSIGGFVADNAGSLLQTGATLGSAGLNYAASQKAADVQQSSAKNAIQAQRDAMNMRRDIYEQNREDMKPYRAAGYGALDAQSSLLGLGEGGMDQAMETLRDTPGYQFARDEGMRGVERSQAAKGMALSGNTLKALQDRGTSLAEQTYGNRLNQFASLAGTGQSATGTTAQMGQNFGAAAQNAAGNVGNAMMGAAGARGSAYLTGANQAGNALNSLSYIWGGR